MHSILTMRYAPAENLLRLARRLAATRIGLTLDEMSAELDVGRRTAERLRDSLAAMFPELDHHDDESRTRRWRLPTTALAGLANISIESVAAVETAAREYDRRGETDRAALLRDAATSLRLAMKPSALLRAEPDLAALMEAEGIAMRPGPRPIMAEGLLATLRQAILGMQMIEVNYTNRTDAAPVRRTLCPYGLLYGGRGWLIAHQEGKPNLHLWRLDRLDAVTPLDRTFPRREDFSLTEFAARSFGVFQEDAMDVTLRFTPSAAEDASRWQFHPTQHLTRDADGTLTVRFRAGGTKEICDHILTWDNSVTVLSPPELARQLAGRSSVSAQHHGRALEVSGA